MNHDPRQNEFANLWSSLRIPCSGWTTDFLVARFHESVPAWRRAAVKMHPASKKTLSYAGLLRFLGLKIRRRERRVGTPMVCWRCHCLVSMRFPE